MTPSWAGLVLDHLWQSTWFASALALVAVLLRQDQARVRCWLWFAAGVKFLVPWAALAAAGGLMNVWTRADAPPARPMAAVVLDFVTQPFTQERFAVVAEPVRAPSLWSPERLAIILFALWAAGSLVMAGRWCLRRIALRRVLREATTVEEGREARLLRRLQQADGGHVNVALALTDQAFGPGTAGSLSPVIVWPREMSGRLTDEEMTAVLAHELAHVRRRDGVTAALFRLTEALFWFNPLVWWIGRRLEIERERACDEAVLRSGGAPEAYAEALVKTCQFHLAVPLTCGAGRDGALLTSRVAGILWPTHRRALPATAVAVLLVLGAGAIATPVIAAAVVPPQSLGLGPSPWFQAARLLVAWAPRTTTGKVALDARFRSLAIEPSSPGVSGGLQTFEGGRLVGEGVLPLSLVRVAYGSFKEVPVWALVGMPDWAKRERFHIRARAEHEFVNDATGEPRYLTTLLQRLLADEFGLVVHRETRTMPIYALVRSGPALGAGLRPSTSTCWRAGEEPIPAIPLRPRLWCKSAPWQGGITERASLAWLANVLSSLTPLGRPVVDHTGLRGFYDMEWTAGSRAESIAAALEAQLGLRLEPREEPVEVLVVDHIERPRAASLARFGK